VRTAEEWADYVFGLPDFTQFVIFAVHGLFVFGVSLGLLKLFNARSKQVAQWLPVGPFFASISMVFALFLAFHAADIWSHKRSAERAFIQAGSAIKRFNELVSPTQMNVPEAAAAVRRYVVAVKEEEWIRHRNQKASDKAAAALRDLQAITVRIARDTPGPAASQAFALVDDIATTRSDRLWIGQNHTEFNSWLAVLLIGFMTHLAVASVHLDRPRAGALALGLLAVTTTIAYWSLGVVDDPYRHLDKLDPMSWLG
jgi:hypothetical protein